MPPPGSRLLWRSRKARSQKPGFVMAEEDEEERYGGGGSSVDRIERSASSSSCSRPFLGVLWPLGEAGFSMLDVSSRRIWMGDGRF